MIEITLHKVSTYTTVVTVTVSYSFTVTVRVEFRNSEVGTRFGVPSLGTRTAAIKKHVTVVKQLIA